MVKHGSLNKAVRKVDIGSNIIRKHYTTIQNTILCSVIYTGDELTHSRVRRLGLLAEGSGSVSLPWKEELQMKTRISTRKSKTKASVQQSPKPILIWAFIFYF